MIVMLNNYLVVAPYVRYVLRPGLNYAPAVSTPGMVYRVNNGSLSYVESSTYTTYRVDVPDDVYTTFEYTGRIANHNVAVVFFDKYDNVISFVDNIAASGPVLSKTFAIPSGTAYIMAPVAGVTTTHFRLTFEDVDLTAENSVRNWADMETILSRDGMTAVFPEAVPEITVAAYSQGYRVLQGLFRGSGMRADARLSVYKRNDYDNGYTTVCHVPLDFTTYNEAEESITIGGVDASLNSLINSRGGIEYDIPVSQLSPSTWRHTPLSIREWASYTLPMDQSMTVGFIPANEPYCLVSITHTESERLPGGIEYDIKGQQVEAGLAVDNYFAGVPQYVDTISRTWLRMKFKLRVKTTYAARVTLVAPVDAQLVLVRTGLTGEQKELIAIGAITSSYSETQGLGTPSVTTYTEYTVDNAQELPMAPGVKYRLALYWDRATDGNQPVEQRGHQMMFAEFDAFTMMWEARSASTLSPLSVHVVEPAALLQALLDKMQEGTTPYTRYTAEIAGMLDDKAKIMLTCGESLLRRVPAAFHCSLQDFREWMRVMGWEYEIDGTVLRYYPRDRVFAGACPIPLRAEEVADLVITPDTSFAYTAVDIGYDKVDLDMLIGESDPMGTATYSTGLLADSRSVLELISPFRADPIGIDLLIRRGYYEYTVTGSDSDAKGIYAVALVESPTGELTEYMGVAMRAQYPASLDFTVSGGAQPPQYFDLFNAILHPRILVERNNRYIGIAAPRIYYGSSTGNDSMTFIGDDAPAGIAPRDAVVKVAGYFQPQIYSFTVATRMPLPPKDARNNTLGFKWHGRTLAGYIKNVRKNIADDRAVEWELWRYDGCE